MAVEWQDYTPAPPVRIEVGPAKKRRVVPRTVCGDRPRDVIPQVPGADALALPPPVSGDDEMGFDSSISSADPQPGLGAGAPALPAPPPLLSGWCSSPSHLAQRRPATAAAAPAARPATGAKARGKAHPQAHAKARAKAHPKAHAKAAQSRGMQLGCSKCRWTSCSVCRDLEWRQRRAAREARAMANR